MKILSTLVLLAALAVPLRGQILERVLVKVNGDIFTQTELEERQTAAIRSRIGNDLKPDVANNTEELKKAIDEVTPELLVSAVDEILMLQMGKEKGYKLSDDQFKDWLEKMRKENNLQDDQKFYSALKQEGMTVEDLRKNIEKSFMVNQVQRDEVGSKLSITEEEARQFYLAHKEDFAEPASVTLREIIIDVPATTKGGQAVMSVATEDDAKQKIEAVRARIMAGEDFGKVAAEISASASKANGGLIGPINLSEVSPALQQMIEKMKPGEVTQPIRAARGFQILKLETLKPAAIQPFESVRDLVADKVHDARQQAEVRKFLSRVRGQAIIEWKNEELKKMYEKQVAIESARGSL